MKLLAAFTCVALAFALTAAAAQAQAPAAPTTPPAGAPEDPDLQKKIDDALKQIEKLDKAIPDDAREEMRNRIIRANPVFGGGMRDFPRTTNPAFALGMMTQSPMPVLVDQLKLPPAQGQVLYDVRIDSIAAKAGLQKHDILLELNGQPVPSAPFTFYNQLRELKPGSEVTALVIRQGQKEALKKFTIPEQPAAPGAAPQPAARDFPLPAPGGNFGRVQIAVGGAGGSSRLFINGDEQIRIRSNDGGFKGELANGDVKITVDGKVENGRPTPANIAIEAGDTKINARTIDDVPARHRAAVARILEHVK